jgi:hypothetical protein
VHKPTHSTYLIDPVFFWNRAVTIGDGIGKKSTFINRSRLSRCVMFRTVPLSARLQRRLFSMKVIRVSAIAAALVALDLVTSTAMAQLVAPRLEPLRTPECSGGGLGRKTPCKWSLPPLYLTEEQVQIIQQRQNENVEELNKQKPQTK